MSLREKAASGLVWSFLIQGGHQVIGFVVSIILARLLLPEEFGLIGMITIFIAIGRTLVDGGLSSSLIRTPKPDQEDYSTVFFINLAGSVLIYLIIFFSAPFIASFFDQPELTKITRVLCLSFIIGAFSTVQSTRLNKNLQFKTQFKVQLPSLIVGSAVGIWMAYNGYGVWSLVIKDLVKSGVGTIQLWIYSKWTPSFIFNLEKFKSHFNFGYKLTLTNISNTFFDNIYNLIIGKFFSAAQLGFYTRARSLEQLPSSFLFLAFNRVAYPLLSQVADDENRLKSVYKRLMIQVLFWVVPVLVITGVLATPLFRFLLTEKWLPAVPYFQILVLGGLIYPLHTYNLNICMVKGRSDIVLKLSVLKNSLTVAGAIVAVFLGIYALLWAIVIVNLLVTLVNAHQSGKLINYSLKEQLLDVLPVFGMGIISGVLAYLLDAVLLTGSQDLIRLLFSGVFGFLVYFGLSVVTRNIAFEEFKLFFLPKFKSTFIREKK